MVYKIIIYDNNMIKFFENREYFVRKYYKSVVLSAITEDHMIEIDRMILMNKWEFDIFTSIDKIEPKNMSYEVNLNGYCIQDSNMKRFKSMFNKFVDKFYESHKDGFFRILGNEIISTNNMVNDIKLYLVSYENTTLSKSWFDYNFYYRLNSFLKNYNNKYKKRKNVISKK